MRHASVAALMLVAAGCGDLFSGDKAPQGYACSPTGGCPPGQQCVPGEHVCRTPCTQTSLVGTGSMGNNGQCNGLGGGNSGPGWSCDYDHFCRPGCFGGGPGCSTCGDGSQLCDLTVNICRPTCSSGCPSSWGCVDLTTGSTTGGPPMVCNACRPNATNSAVTLSFATVVNYSTGVAGQHTTAVAVGDLGGGRPSVIALDQSAMSIYVFHTNSDGTLATPPTKLSNGTSPFRAAIVDLTGDGKPDLVIAGTPSTSVFPGNGDGTLGAPIAITFASPGSTNLTVGDLDHDGRPDVAISGLGTALIRVLAADGAGGIKVIANYDRPNQNVSFGRIGAVDLNGDQKDDLWVDDQHGEINTFINPGGNGFSFVEGPRSNPGFLRVDLTAFDVDGDKKPDLVMLQNPTGSGQQSVFVAENNGSGAFVTTTEGVLVPGQAAIDAGDFDGNGTLDAAVADQMTPGQNAVHVALGDGKRLVFAGSFKIPSGGPGSIAVGDLNGDGKPDIVVGLGGGGVGVLLNTTPAH